MRSAKILPQIGCLPLFPASGPDEHISSRIVRYHIKCGHGSSIETFKRIFGKLPFPLNNLVIPHLRRLAEKLPGSADHNLTELEMEGTLLPLCQQFNRPGGAATHTNSAMRMLTRVVGDPAATRICVDCLIEDERDHGFPYLHRSHQIPGTTACWRHGRPLVDQCPACDRPYSMSKELILTAWNGCECGLLPDELNRRVKKNATKSEVEFANFAKELLTNEPIRIAGQDLVELYRIQAKKLGMGWGTHNVNRQKIISRLTSFYGKSFLSRIDPAFRSGKMTGWMRVFERSASFEAPVYRHILVTHFLFREYAHFRKSALKLLSDKESMPETSARKVIKVPEHEELTAMLHELSMTALRFNYSIKQLWNTRSGTMKRLVKISPDSVKKLESKISRMKTAKKKDSGKINRNSVPRDPLADQRWSEALVDTSNNFYQSDERPRFVSANALLKNTSFRAKGATTPKSAQYPLAFDALRSHTESQWHFYARRILWSMQGISDPEVPSYLIVKLAGLEYHKGLAVLEYFADCPRAVGSSIKLVNEILARKKIDRNWLGPCPERTFLKKAGRAHQAAASWNRMTGRRSLEPHARA